MRMFNWGTVCVPLCADSSSVKLLHPTRPYERWGWVAPTHTQPPLQESERPAVACQHCPPEGQAWCRELCGLKEKQAPNGTCAPQVTHAEPHEPGSELDLTLPCPAPHRLQPGFLGAKPLPEALLQRKLREVGGSGGDTDATGAQQPLENTQTFQGICLPSEPDRLYSLSSPCPPDNSKNYARVTWPFSYLHGKQTH